ncbi:class I SAM-dependent methyltransferase [Actinokineospora bangkokensis]|uniref:Methyltransferase n=1 Tax=Actinokineospora bangkokensis TaxID=1193682 RepID=A0A1Q9LQ72_9PSEU|nr:class I SAM-dependent methyltransferase [Actinokineospora bangkokensis]OLR94175.1 methyltransferase [Actinokineospora bangkokensis]
MRPDAVRQVLDAELSAARARRGGAPLVLDVGAGSGVLAVSLAADGCAVTVVEPSPNALATLHRRAAEAGVADRITAVQADSDTVADHVPGGGADLVLAHGLLEVVDDPAATAAALAGAVAPGGALSVVVANRFAAIVQRAMSGKVTAARALLDDPASPGETLLRLFDVDGLGALLTGAGLEVELVQGQGVLSDLVTGAVQEANRAGLAELELAAARVPPLRDIATRLHAIARR